jgi:hypothetical protein
MKLYVVRNKEGKFFRPIGYGGSGQNWQEKLEKAKFYPKVGVAKARAAFWYKEYPSYGCPDVLEFELDVANAKILDVKDETEKKIKKKEQKHLQMQIEAKEYQRQQLEKEKADIEARLNKLK